MSLFKIKSNKNFSFDNRTTLHSKHKEYINQFGEQKESLPNYKKKMKDLIAQYQKIYSNLNTDGEIDEKYQESVIELNKLFVEIINLKKEIKNIESDKNIKNYYLDLANIYSKFYQDDNPTIRQDNNFGDFVTVTKRLNREKVLDAYMQKFTDVVEDYYNIDGDVDVCKDCHTIDNFAENRGCRECKSCGRMEYIIDEVSKPSYKDRSNDKMYSFSYKKINHFNEWINQIQGKEVTKIPKDVFDKLLVEIKKERIMDSRYITQKKVRGYLRKLKLSKYYEHVPYITLQLGGEKPPQIPHDIETELRRMFIEISAPFITYCPKNRRNFPRYTFMIYKCCELIGYIEILPFLPLLKTRTRLCAMDEIWKKICDQKGWPFISTV